MFYRLLADLIVIVHFLWILFVIVFYFLTLYSLLVKNERFLHLKFLRTVHLAGILMVSVFIFMGEYCPLTWWEIKLRNLSGIISYKGSFIVHYIEKFVYPDVHPLVVQIPSIVIGITTLIFFIIKSPFNKKEGDGSLLPANRPLLEAGKNLHKNS
ncbi:MAG: DUF2784 domain-containing protein [Spirochaetes bacterium]|nr:DUF2784 domain-containing protein [Spirochaetota bacterium]